MTHHTGTTTNIFFQKKGKKRHRTDKTTKPGTKKPKLEDGKEKEKEKEKDKGKQKKTGNNSKSEGALSKRRKGN